jgi:hypothetical protein
MKRLKNSLKNVHLNRTHAVLICVFVIGVFFRFYNTPDRFGFDKDPTRDALVALHGMRTQQYPLVGPSSGIGSFNFGPWYYYELIAFQTLFPFVYAPFYFIPLFSLTFIVVMYCIGVNLKDRVLGLILAFLSAVSPAQIGPSGGLSNPNLVSSHAGLAILFFILYMKKKRKWWFCALWGFVLGVGINHHFQMIPLVLLPIIAILLRKKDRLKDIGFFALGLGISFIPLLIFNLLTNWNTLTGFTLFLQGSHNYVPNSWKIYIGTFWPGFWSYLYGFPTLLGIGFGFAVMLLHGYLFYKRKITLTYGLLLGLLILIFLGLRYYNGQREYYYLFFIHPFLYLFGGMTLWFLWKKTVGKVAVLFFFSGFMLLSFPHNQISMSDRQDLLTARARARQLETKYPKDTFVIYNCHDRGIEASEGVAYFLDVDHRISNKGKQIAFIPSVHDCPGQTEEMGSLGNTVVETSEKSSSLKKEGWKSISSESVYTDTVNWWRK